MNNEWKLGSLGLQMGNMGFGKLKVTYNYEETILNAKCLDFGNP